MYYFEIRGSDHDQKPYREVCFYKTKKRALIEREKIQNLGWRVTSVEKVPDGLCYAVVPPPLKDRGPLSNNPVYEAPADDPGWPYR